MSFYIYKREDGVYIKYNKKGSYAFVYDIFINIKEKKKLRMIFTSIKSLTFNKHLKEMSYILEKEYEIKDKLNIYIRDFINNIDKSLYKVDLLERFLNKFLINKYIVFI